MNRSIAQLIIVAALLSAVVIEAMVLRRVESVDSTTQLNIAVRRNTFTLNGSPPQNARQMTQQTHCRRSMLAEWILRESHRLHPSDDAHDEIDLLGTWFVMHDSDKNHFLDRNELFHALLEHEHGEGRCRYAPRMCVPGVIKHRVESLLDHDDADRNGLIDKHEFIFGH